MRNVKVFISSPGDMQEQRQAVDQVIEDLNKRASFRDNYKFVAYRYEEFAPPVTGEGAQDVVNQQMLRPSEADIVICMLWSRMGTPLADMNAATGQPYASGTEYEFYDAYNAYRRRGRPTLLLYRYMAPPPAASDPLQIAKVIAFFERFNGPRATLSGLYKQFGSTSELEAMVANDVDSVITTWDRPTRRFVDTVLRPYWPLFILLIAALGVLAYFLTRPQHLDTYPFSVGIANFAVDSSAGSGADAAALSQAFYTDFRTRLSEQSLELPVTVGVYSPDQIGVVQGSDSDTRAANAAALVKRLKDNQNVRVDVLIYGVITRQNGDLVVLPEFYVTDTGPDVSEVGRLDLSAALYPPNLSQSRVLSAELTARSQTLTYIAQGIVEMVVQRYDDAYSAFDQALAIPNVTGRELLYTLRGNASLANYNRIVADGDVNSVTRLPALLKQAKSDFSSAVDPTAGGKSDYARGYIGLASVLYLTAVRPVAATQQWDQIPDTQLHDILATYQKALDATDRPASADIPTKAALGMGQVYMLRYLANPQDKPSFDAAQTQFQQVIAAYGDPKNPKNPGVQDFAAQAYAAMGLLKRETNDLDGASQAYQTAIDVSQLKARKDVFRRNLIEVDIQKARLAHDTATAAKDYEQLLTFHLLPSEAAAVLFQEGTMYTEAGQSQPAADAFKRGATLPGLTDDNPLLEAKLYAVLGDSYYDLHQLTDSIAAYQKAQELDPVGQAHLSKLIDDTRNERATQQAAPATLPATPAATFAAGE